MLWRASPLTLSAGTSWFEDSYTFSDYGTGVRYLYIEMGGYSANYWAGEYGPHFDDASASVIDPAPEPDVMALSTLGAGLIFGYVWLRRSKA